MLISRDARSQELLPFRVDSLWGYKNKEGTVIIGPQFQHAGKFTCDIAVVAKNDKFGAIDKDNHLIIPFNHDYLRLLDSSEFLFGYRAKYFGEYFIGVMNKQGKIKFSAEYSYIFKYNNAYIVTKNKDSIIGKTGNTDIRTIKTTEGLLDSTGKVLISLRYDNITWTNDSLLVVRIGDLTADKKFIQSGYALFNKKGEQLTGFDYMVFGNFIEGVAKARIGDKFGFIFPTGKLAIPIEFDYCEDFRKGYAIIKQNDKWGAINRDGKIVLEPNLTYEEVKACLKEKFGW